MPIDYGNLITRSWHLTWRHRVLWLFGLIVALGSGSANLRTNNINFSSSTVTPDQFLARYGVLLIIAAIVLVVFLIAWSFVRALAEAALIAATEQIERGESALTVGGVWRLGQAHMLRMWLLNFLVGLIMFALVLLAALPFILGLFVVMRTNDFNGPGVGIIGVFALLCCAVPVLLLVFAALWLIQQHAMRALVLNRQGVGGALQAGWATLRSHFAPSLITMLIYVGLSIVVGVVVLVVLAPLIGLLVFAGASGTVSAMSVALLAMVAILGWLLATVVLAIPTVFFSALWTELWLQLHGGVVPTYMPATPAQPSQS